MSDTRDETSDSVHSALAGSILGLEHVAIVVASIEKARGAYEALGLKTVGDVEHVANQKVNVLMFDAGGSHLELVEPASDDSPVSGFLNKRGEGLHHLAYRVDDIDAALARLRELGLRLIDEQPRPGAHGTRTAFVHPKSTGGVLTELVEHPS